MCTGNILIPTFHYTYDSAVILIRLWTRIYREQIYFLDEEVSLHGNSIDIKNKKIKKTGRWGQIFFSNQGRTPDSIFVEYNNQLNWVNFVESFDATQ